MSQTIVLAGGCFWCLDGAYRQVNGVEESLSGYTGGTLSNPSYEQVCTGQTGHAEAVRITFDPNVVSEDDILNIFWTIHDPTSLNKQGADIGTEYRSAIFYKDTAQKERAEASKQAAQASWEDPIVTEIVPLGEFYPAEGYHQNYFAEHPEQAYCQVVINPKVSKLRQKFAYLLL
jgi:peptide-methionine (S)-S-oxide reductase